MRKNINPETMKKTLLLWFFLLFVVSSMAQFAELQTTDSICGHKIVPADDGKTVLGWYRPDVPGAVFDKVVGLATEFLKTTPIEPQTGLPMYLVTCCFSGPHMTPGKNIIADHWLHNPACVYAGTVQSLAVRYMPYSGDDSLLSLAGNMLDYQLGNGTTPDDWVWPEVPYASADPFERIYQGGIGWENDGMRGDGLHGVEPDKIGELGYAYLLFYEITIKKKYLDAAIHCADALAAHVRDVRPDTATFSRSDLKRSPWPFRVNARNGIVVSEYCSNVLEPVKLFDELLRLRDRLSLSTAQVKAYHSARDIAWEWMFSINGPMKTFVWNGYFEDIPNDPERTNRVQITPVEVAKYLIEHPEYDNYISEDVPALLHWVSSAFKTDGMDAIKEQTWCYEPMGSHTARYGSACAMYYGHSGIDWYKDQAFRFLNFASYMTYDNGVVAVGPNWHSSWFSDGYGDYIRHFMDAIAAIPEWAPAGEDHLLKSTSVVRQIRYSTDQLAFSTFDDASTVILRLDAKPLSVTVDGKRMKLSKTLIADSWTWEALQDGGIARLSYTAGNQVVIHK